MRLDKVTTFLTTPCSMYLNLVMDGRYPYDMEIMFHSFEMREFPIGVGDFTAEVLFVGSDDGVEDGEAVGTIVVGHGFEAGVEALGG